MIKSLIDIDDCSVQYVQYIHTLLYHIHRSPAEMMYSMYRPRRIYITSPKGDIG